MYRTYIFYRACGCFLYAPSIYTVSLQKRWMCVSTSLLVQRSTSVYFAEHKFDRCQTCFYLIHAASVPMFKRRFRLNLQVSPKAKHCYCKSSTDQNGQGCPWFHTLPANVHRCIFAGKVSVPSISKDLMGDL